jgi:hypothetical protein
MYEAVLTRRFPVDAEGFPCANGDDPAGEIVAKIRRPLVRDRSFYSSLAEMPAEEIPERLCDAFLVSVQQPDEETVTRDDLKLADMDFWLMVAIQDEVQKLFNRSFRLGESDGKPDTSPSA